MSKCEQAHVTAEQSPGTAQPGSRGPVIASDLGRFPDIGSVGLSADGALVVAVVSTPDIDANGYQRVVVTGPVDGSAPLRGLPSATAEAETLPAWAPAGTDLATVRKDEDGWSIWR